MDHRRASQRNLADQLDAYIESLEDGVDLAAADRCRPESADQRPSQLASAQRMAEMLHSEGIACRADPDFVTALSEQLHAAHREKPAKHGAPIALPPEPRQRRRPMDRILPRQRRTLGMRLTWGLTTLCAVVATLVVVALLAPRSLPADRILAASEAATRRMPGSIEHTLVEVQLEERGENGTIGVSHYVVEDWQRIGGSLDGYPLTIERVTVRSAPEDRERGVPLSWAYETWSRRCYLDLTRYPNVYRDPGTDAQGCVTIEQVVQFSAPGAMYQAMEAGPQTWAGRLQVNVERLQDRRGTFQGRPVYSVTEQTPDATLTLHIDRDSHLPVGFVAETATHRLTQIVHTYEIVSPADLTTDPFAWPPALATDGDIQPNPGE